MSPPIKQVSFAGGEIAPFLYARTDNALYEKSLRTMRNHIAMRHGGATGRPGTQYVGTTLNGGNPVRLIPFIFNETGLGQSYVLEFGNQYISFYQNGGVVISAPSVPYKIVSPYLQADLATLQYAESADVITITHKNYPVYELKRFGATNWTITQVQFGAKQALLTIDSVVGTAGSNTYLYIVTTVTANGDEGTQDFSSTAAAINVQAPQNNPITLDWFGPTNPPFGGFLPVSYRIYRQQFGTGGAGGAFGFVGIVQAPPPNTPAIHATFVDSVQDPDFTNAPPLTSPFEKNMGPGNYPSVVGFSQQRRVFANTINNPLGFWESKPGVFYNFDIRINTPDDDPIIASIAGEEVNAIQHVLELKFALMLTAGAEIYIQGNGSGVVTPSAINASVQSQYGASPLKPLKVGDTLLFNQALGSFIRDFAFDFAIDGYRGNDITVFSSHLFEGHQIVDWAYQKIPDSIVWAVREDGVLLGLTYMREQQILAWHRHDFVNGFVEGVCSIPENGQYAVYLAIRRVINGSTVRYIERMSSRIWTDPLTATYLDCFAQYDGRNTQALDMELIAPGNNWSTGATAYQQALGLKCTLASADHAFFTPQMVGSQIFIQDALFVSSNGDQGNQIRCTIQTFVDSADVIVTPNRAVPGNLQNIATTNWSLAVKTVTGLDYLNGQKVSVWADRFVVGSPLNSNVDNVYTVSGGSITLDKCYAVIYVGLPMIQDLETLDLETNFGESIIASRKRTAKLNVYTYRTRGFFVGSENPDNNMDNTAGDLLFQLEEFKRGTSRQTYDEAVDLATDQDYVLFDSRWNKNGRLFIRNVDPIPVTILAISPGSESKAPSPFYNKV